jgi:hypothetical protein
MLYYRKQMSIYLYTAVGIWRQVLYYYLAHTAHKWEPHNLPLKTINFISLFCEHFLYHWPMVDPSFFGFLSFLDKFQSTEA